MPFPTLGRYIVESQLGEGGMGVVLRARDPDLDRIVAIKVLPPDQVVDADRKRRFLQEAKAASALNHPNIVTIHDVGVEGDTHFIVMEYVPGATLDRRVPPDGLPARKALTIAVPIADALAKAHEAGIIHRDLKPSNVMVTDEGVVKVLDFGIAKLLESPDASDATRTVLATAEGTTVGTPGYMSPEQADGRRLDARSDIFSFGAVLYEVLTGRQAFSGSSRLSVLAKILNDEPTAPSLLVPSIPHDVEKAVLRCLRKDPSRRYQTMADLKVALQDVLDDLGTGSQPRPELRPSSTRRTWAIAAGLALALGAGYGAWRLTQAPDDAQGPMQAVPLTSLPGQVRFPAISPDGNHVAFAWSGPAQDNTDVYVQQIGAGSPLRLTTDPAGDSSPAWSPDGRAIAFLRRLSNSAIHELRLIPPLGGPERKIADIQPANPLYRPLTLAWCPDSSCVLVADGQGQGKPEALFVFGIDGAARRQITFPPAGVIIDSDPAISPDGRLLVFRRDVTPFTGEMYRLALGPDLTPAGEPTRLTDKVLSGTRPAWMPDSRNIVFSAKLSLWGVDALGGGAPTRLPFVGLDGIQPALSGLLPGGGIRLVYVHVFSDSNVWRLDTTAAGVAAAGPPRPAISSTRVDHLPMLSPDGTRVAFFSGRSGEFELWVSAPDGSNAVQLTTLKSLPGFARWSPDGEMLAFHSDPEGHPDVLTIRASGGTPRILTIGTVSGGYPSYSRDGRWVYFAGSGSAADGQLRVQKVPTGGGPPIQLTSTPGAIPIESYDGRDLYYLEAAERPSALWRLPVSGGGAPTKVLDGIVNGAYDVVERGIYYIDRVSADPGSFFGERQTGETRLRYFDFATGQTTTIATGLGTLSLGLSASRDGRTVFFSRVDSSADELMLVENFR